MYVAVELSENPSSCTTNQSFAQNLLLLICQAFKQSRAEKEARHKENALNPAHFRVHAVRAALFAEQSVPLAK